MVSKLAVLAFGACLGANLGGQGAANQKEESPYPPGVSNPMYSLRREERLDLAFKSRQLGKRKKVPMVNRKKGIGRAPLLALLSSSIGGDFVEPRRLVQLSNHRPWLRKKKGRS